MPSHLLDRSGYTFHEGIQCCLDAGVVISFQCALCDQLAKGLCRIPVLSANLLCLTELSLLCKCCDRYVFFYSIRIDNVVVARAALALVEELLLRRLVCDEVSQKNCPSCVLRIAVYTNKLIAGYRTLLNLRIANRGSLVAA